MTLVWIAIAVGIAALLLLLVLKRAGPGGPKRAWSLERRADAVGRGGAGQTPVPSPPVAPPRSSAAGSAPSESASIDPPPELIGWAPRRAADLGVEERRALLATCRAVPRPPKLLDHLLSPEFVQAASSSELVELIAGEPLIAARVLAAVNSPRYGLASPVGSIGQAVTYLGANTVRSLCLQYLLRAAFAADTPERARRVGEAWTASALASELAQQLATKLGHENKGAVMGAAVLSFLGRLATTATVPAERLASLCGHSSLFVRANAEQAALGVPASEIGRLLMQAWGLPQSVVDDAAAVDDSLLLPDPRAALLPHDRALGTAIAFVAARAAERLASGTLGSLAGFDLGDADNPDLHGLRARLPAASAERLAAALRAPDVEAAVHKVRDALHAG
jgi:HD-like signal output (HDOD) protein